MDPDDAIGFSSKHALQPGRPITKEELVSPVLVERDQPVMIVCPAFAAGGEPYSGAIRYRGFLRIIGTFIGCIAALTIIILMIRTPLLMLIV
ncbi:FUSC family protein, partial [Enterobacter hormaechei subsp. steigerwaltii]|nr:FUSC family protein [Enterobacter hormaechei subsp. steigerwaltii]